MGLVQLLWTWTPKLCPGAIQTDPNSVTLQVNLVWLFGSIIREDGTTRCYDLWINPSTRKQLGLNQWLLLIWQGREYCDAQKASENGFDSV